MTIFSKLRTFRSIAFTLVVAILSLSFTNPNSKTVVLNAGTPINISTVNSISSMDANAGQIVNFEVDSDIMAEGEVVIPKGSIATGQIVRVDHSKGLGKAGFVEVRIKSVKSIDGQDIYLTDSNIYKEGDDKSTTAIVLGVLICILFLTMKGGEAYIPANYSVQATVAGNTNIEMAK